MTAPSEEVVGSDIGTDAAGALPTRPGDPSFDPEEEPRPSIEVADVGDSSDPTDPMVRRKSSDEDETRQFTLPPVERDIDRVGDRTLLELAIRSAPDPEFEGRHLPSTRFAVSVALCNDRTLRRYEAGDRDLPPLLREKLLKRVKLAQKIAIDSAPETPLAAWKLVDKALTKAAL